MGEFMGNKTVFISHSVDETKDFAKNFAKTLSGGTVLCMYGDLGAGKTAFVQGMAEGLLVGDYVSSPTFTIINEYEGELPLYHFDVYRISDSDEMYEIGYDEYINSDGICVIEWAELIEDILPDDRIKVTINKLIEDDDREIIIEVM